MEGKKYDIKKMNYNEFVRYLVQKRKSLRISLRQMAADNFMSPATLVKFEKGCTPKSNNYKNLDVIDRYCKYLNVNFNYIVAD